MWINCSSKNIFVLFIPHMYHTFASSSIFYYLKINMKPEGLFASVKQSFYISKLNNFDSLKIYILNSFSSNTALKIKFVIDISALNKFFFLQNLSACCWKRGRYNKESRVLVFFFMIYMWWRRIWFRFLLTWLRYSSVQNFQRLSRSQIFSLSDCILNDKCQYLVHKICYHIHGDISFFNLIQKLKNMKITMILYFHSAFIGGQWR